MTSGLKKVLLLSASPEGSLTYRTYITLYSQSAESSSGSDGQRIA